MSKLITYSAAALLVGTFVACSESQEEVNLQQENTLTTITASLPNQEHTRVHIDASGLNEDGSGSLALKWDADDKIAVYDHANADSPKVYDITIANGTQATFTGDAIAANTQVTAFYPQTMIQGTMGDAKVIDLSNKLTQKGTNTYEHIQESNVLYATATTTADGLYADLSFQPTMAYLSLTFNGLPAGARPVEAYLHSESVKFYAKRSLHMSDGQWAGDDDASAVTSSHVALTLADFEMPTGPATTYTANFVTIPTDHSSNQMELVIKTQEADGSAKFYFSPFFNAKDLVSGRRYYKTVAVEQGAAFTRTAGKDGTSEATAFEIATPQDLAQLSFLHEVGATGTAQGVGAVYFKQVGEIDMTACDNFVPIGTESTPFLGLYDGGNHKISHLTISGDYMYAGLIGCGYQYVGGSSTASVVSNLSLEDLQIDVVSTAAEGDVFVGGIAGRSGATGTLEIDSSSQITATAATTGALHQGGIIGRRSGKTLLEDVALYHGTLRGTNNGPAFVGGIFGSGGSDVGKEAKGTDINSVTKPDTKGSDGTIYATSNDYVVASCVIAEANNSVGSLSQITCLAKGTIHATCSNAPVGHVDTPYPTISVGTFVGWVRWSSGKVDFSRTAKSNASENFDTDAVTFDIQSATGMTIMQDGVTSTY